MAMWRTSEETLRGDQVSFRCSRRAASAIEPDSDGYTVNACCTWSTVNRVRTAIAIGWISSRALGATTTPPTTTPEPGRQNSLTNPSMIPCIFARGFVDSARLTTSASARPSSTACWDTPTVAISGAVNTFDETVFRLNGDTASPSACHIATRPCMAATEASMRTPVQSPAAYTPRAEVRDTRSTSMNPDDVVCTPHSCSPRSSVLGIEPTAIKQWLPSRVRPSVRVTTTPSPSPSPFRCTEAAREREYTIRPRRANTSCSTVAASAYSPGSTRSRDDTSTASLPSALYALANSAPVTPEPTTINRSGNSVSS